MEIAFAAEDESKKEIEKWDDAFEVGNDDLFTTAAPMPVHIWLVPAHGGTLDHDWITSHSSVRF